MMMKEKMMMKEIISADYDDGDKYFDDNDNDYDNN